MHMPALIVVVALVFGAQHAALAVDQPSDTAVIAWTKANYAAIADRVLGDPRDADTGPTSESVWVLVARIRPPYDAPEAQLVLSETQNGHVVLRYSVAIDGSIYQQVLALHASHLAWDVAEISRHVHVKQRQVNAVKNQARLRDAIQQFSKIRITLRLPNILVSDPTVYHLWTFSGSQWAELNLVAGPMSSQAVVRWIETLRRDLDRLAQR
jgi:hypothetical protein